MWERVVWTMVSVGVVALAGYEGGPHRLDDFRLSSIWGATPNDPEPDCNARVDATIDCPVVEGVSCGPGQEFYQPAAPGGVNVKRFDPSNRRACNWLAECPVLWHWEFVTDRCRRTYVPQQ